MNRSTLSFKEAHVAHCSVTPIMQQTIDERLELEFSSTSPDGLTTSLSSDLTSCTLLESPVRTSAKLTYDAKLTKMGSPRKSDELDCSNHQRRGYNTTQRSRTDLDESHHVRRWTMEE